MWLLFKANGIFNLGFCFFSNLIYGKEGHFQIHIIDIDSKSKVASGLILPLRPAWCHRDENKALLFPHQSLDAGWWNSQRYSARMSSLIWWALSVLGVSFDHWTSALTVTLIAYFLCAVHKINNLHLPSCDDRTWSIRSLAPLMVWAGPTGMCS